MLSFRVNLALIQLAHQLSLRHHSASSLAVEAASALLCLDPLQRLPAASSRALDGTNGDGSLAGTQPGSQHVYVFASSPSLQNS